MGPARWPTRHCCVDRSQVVSVPGSGGVRSDHQGEFGEGFGKSSSRRYIGTEVVETTAEVLDEAWPATMTLAVRSCFSPLIGRSRAFRRPWSVSNGLLAWTSVSWNAAGRISSRTRG